MSARIRSLRGSRHLAVSGIRFYQRHLSPLKGFRCAHAVYFGGESCSAAILRLVEARGVSGSWPDILGRFAACRGAYDLLRAEGFVQGGFGAQGVCCCGPIPIPFKCGG